MTTSFDNFISFYIQRMKEPFPITQQFYKTIKTKFLLSGWTSKGNRKILPRSSPDLTPMDFLFWEFVKDKVYVKKPFTIIEELKNYLYRF